MLNNGQLLIIDTTGLNIDISQYLVDYKVLYPKLWAEGTGRNLAGSMKATLIGIYTKLQVSIRSVDLDNFAQIIQALNKASVSCQYYDFETKQMQTETFYFGDLETQLISAQISKAKINTFSIIAYDKRTVSPNA